MPAKKKIDLVALQGEKWDEEERVEEERVAANIKSRRGIAGGLKKLSKSGKLTGDLLKEARGRATEAGVTDDQFASFMGKNSIRQNATPATVVGSTPIPTAPTTSTPQTATLTGPSVGATPAPTDIKIGTAPISDRGSTLKQAATGVRATGASSPEEATQKVMSERNFGTGLGALEAMQDPKYVLGSGSSLSEPARSIGPESGKYRRAARRLRRKGYGAAAQQMAMQGEKIRLGEPAIDTEELRAQRASQKMLVGREAMKQDRVLSDLGKRRNKQGKGKETPLAVEYGITPLNNNNGGGSEIALGRSDEPIVLNTLEGRPSDKDKGLQLLSKKAARRAKRAAKRSNT